MHWMGSGMAAAEAGPAVKAELHVGLGWDWLVDYRRSLCCRLDRLLEAHAVVSLVVRLVSMAALVADERIVPLFSVQQSFALED